MVAYHDNLVTSALFDYPDNDPRPEAARTPYLPQIKDSICRERIVLTRVDSHRLAASTTTPVAKLPPANVRKP